MKTSSEKNWQIFLIKLSVREWEVFENKKTRNSQNIFGKNGAVKM